MLYQSQQQLKIELDTNANLNDRNNTLGFKEHEQAAALVSTESDLQQITMKLTQH